jgi:2'-5' RNA ligase
MIRSFIALELSPEIYKNLGLLIDKLKKGVQFTSARPSWVNPESIHLTLKFLGNIEESMIDQIAEVMTNAANETHPFSIRIRDLGVFPNPRQPRVLWCGMTKGEDQTVSIQTKIDRGLAALGFEKESRPFHPHLTLARIKTLKGTAALMDVVKSHQNSLVGECRMDRVILFQSQLHPSGAVYTKLKEALFKQKGVSETEPSDVI